MFSPTESGIRIWPAPAKLNLFLHVNGQRPDGYHELQTLFQLLDWGDELRITVNQSGRISRNCNIDDIPEADDICVLAARLLQAQCNVQQGAHIELKKRIPMGAGLGGGSSDAATVLHALNQLWCCGLTRQQLADTGLELGADVPVFVHGHSALAEGRGEKLRPVSLGQRFYLLIFPEISISTAEIFHHPQLKRDSSRFDINQLSVELAERRVEEQVLLDELGRGESNDLVDAQNDLIDSRNERTSALVDHTLARLRLWRDMGILFISKDGSWVRKLEAEGSRSDVEN